MALKNSKPKRNGQALTAAAVKVHSASTSAPAPAYEPSASGPRRLNGTNLRHLQRGLGNAGVARLFSAKVTSGQFNPALGPDRSAMKASGHDPQVGKEGTADESARALRKSVGRQGAPHSSSPQTAGFAIQRAPVGEEESDDHPFNIPDWMVFAIDISDFRSIELEDIAALNDDQILDLKHRFDTWGQLYENTPDLFYQDYLKAKGKAKQKQALDLYHNSEKIRRAFRFRYGPITEKAQGIARMRGFSIPGATFGPKEEGKTEFEKWIDTVKGGLSGEARQIFLATLPEVKRRLEFLLWDIDYPEIPKTSKYYWMQYGYWVKGGVQNVLTGGRRRTEWMDFAPSLKDAAAAIASAFHHSIERGEGPSSVMSSVDAVEIEVRNGFDEILNQGDGVLNHGITGVNIRDLYEWAEVMRDTSGSVMSCYEKYFKYS